MPRMSAITGNPSARAESIQRVSDAMERPRHLELNDGLRTPSELNDHLRNIPLETIDRQGLVDAAFRAFVGNES